MGINPWVKRKWVRALRSGEYKQGKGFLVYNSGMGFGDEYCCLGVLAAEMVPEFIRHTKGASAPTVDGRTNILPDDLAIMYGLDENTQNDLANMNDDGINFCKIADWIEREL